MSEKYLTVKDVCKILDRNKRTIYAYIRSGQLKAVKPGGHVFIIKESDLEEFIKNGLRPNYFRETYPPKKKDTPKQ